jgi:hypothetical protein
VGWSPPGVPVHAVGPGSELVERTRHMGQMTHLYRIVHAFVDGWAAPAKRGYWPDGKRRLSQ